MNALERLLDQVESLRRTGEIGDGKVAHLHALAATVRAQHSGAIPPSYTMRDTPIGIGYSLDAPAVTFRGDCTRDEPLQFVPPGHCPTQRQGDEYFCAEHGTRWGVDEEAPASCA